MQQPERTLPTASNRYSPHRQGKDLDHVATIYGSEAEGSSPSERATAERAHQLAGVAVTMMRSGRQSAAGLPAACGGLRRLG